MNKWCPRCGKHFIGLRNQVYCDDCETALYLERKPKKAQKVVDKN